MKGSKHKAKGREEVGIMLLASMWSQVSLSSLCHHALSQYEHASAEKVQAI